jgi:hypothetical protein
MHLFENIILGAITLFVGTLLAILMYQIIAPMLVNPNNPNFGDTTGGLLCITCPISYAIVALAVFGYVKLAPNDSEENKD